MKYKFNGTIVEFIESIITSVFELNNDDLDIFNNETKMEVKIYDNICKVLLQKDNPENTEYWYIATMIEEKNYIIIDGTIKETLGTKKDKIIKLLIYLFLWPIVILWFFLNEYTPFHAIKYRKSRLKKLMIKYIGCEEIIKR